MSGYTSLGQAVTMITDTLNKGVGNLPKGQHYYYLTQIVNEMVYSDGYGSWRLTNPTQEFMEEVMKRHMRPKGKMVMEQLQHEENLKKAEELPWGAEKCRLQYGYSLERYMSM